MMLRSLRVLLAAFLVVAPGGCAWRSGGVEHYLGPVLFRYNEPRADTAATHQVIAVGALAEGGSQWGLSLGVVQRTTVSPRFIGSTESAPSTRPVSWSSPFGALGQAEPGRWQLSLFYLRLTAAETAGLVARRLYGAQVVVGRELNAASIGMTAVTRVHMPDDALVLVDYDARAPMSAVFSVWPVGREQELPLSNVLEEVTP
jgi:hypothetical protein